MKVDNFPGKELVRYQKSTKMFGIDEKQNILLRNWTN